MGTMGTMGYGGVLCFVLCCFVTVTGLSEPNTRPTPLNLLNYQVKKVSSQPAEDGFNLTIELTGPVPPEVYVMNYSDSADSLHPLGRPSAEGLLEFHTTTRSLAFAFLHPEGFQVALVNIREDVAAEAVVPDIELFSERGRNIIFERGQNASVNLTARKGDQSMHSHFYVGMAVRDETESNAVILHQRMRNFNDRGFLFPYANLERSSKENEDNVHVVLQTASGEVEGGIYASWVGEINCRFQAEPCLEVSYLATELLPVYQEGHDGPFPEHYLGHLMSWGGEWQGPPDVEYCSVHAVVCPLYCAFAGDRPSAVEFQHVNGTIAPVGQLSLANNGFLSAGALLFRPGAFSGGQEVQYRCVSSSGPVVLGHTITLILEHEARIDWNRSRLTSNNETADVTCVAEGTPTPTLSFLANYDVPMDQVMDPSLYHITHVQLSNTTSQATIRFYDLDVLRSLYSVNCRANNTIRGQRRESWYYFETYIKNP